MLTIYSPEEAASALLRRVPLDDMPIPETLQERIRATFGGDLSPAEAVHRILADVRTHGDAALIEWTRRLDGVDLAPETLRVDDAEIAAAYDLVPSEVVHSLEAAADRIRAFHSRQPANSWMTTDMGGIIGQLVMALDRVGVYAPGGTAPLPSSILMSAIPARVAGVEQVAVMTPPQRDTGDVAPVMLVAADVAEVDEVYRLGGAQAIAALAFGTETIEPVDKVVGAGGLFTALAKRQVYGVVGIDGLAGPTETVVVADAQASPGAVAADLLAQAEHDVLASAILLTPSRPLAEAVQVEVARRLEGLSRAEIIAASFANRSGIVLTADVEQAVALADDYAPEHLCLAVSDPWLWVGVLRHAGGLFLGEHSYEVLGDYIAGPSHVMPTGGTARFASPLSVLDFVRLTSLIALHPADAAGLASQAIVLARAEGLTAHAAAAEERLKHLPASDGRQDSSASSS